MKFLFINSLHIQLLIKLQTGYHVSEIVISQYKRLLQLNKKIHLDINID